MHSIVASPETKKALSAIIYLTKHTLSGVVRMMDNILAPRFIDPVAARKHLEALRWPNGAECPHCGLINATAVRAAPRGPVSVQFVPRTVHRHGRHRVRAFKGRLEQVAALQSPALRVQEGHERPSDPPYVGRHLQNGLVHVPPHPRSHGARAHRPDGRP